MTPEMMQSAVRAALMSGLHVVGIGWGLMALFAVGVYMLVARR